MDVTPLVKQGSQIIQSYADGGFRVSGVVYNAPIIVFPSYSELWKIKKRGDGGVLALEEGERGVSSSTALSSGVEVKGPVLEDFEGLIARADEIDVVLLGCGAQMAFMEPGLKNALRDQGLAVDVMNTGAACRTYNVLMAEGRRVVAALMPV